MLHRTLQPPRGVFQGQNFMTPHIIAYYKLREGYAELSEGDLILSSGTLYGVTVKTHTGTSFDPDPSKPFTSQREAIAYIESLS